MNKTTPHYEHDCKCCNFLGSSFIKKETLDLYFCEQVASPTVIARYGNEGSEYMSGIYSSENSIRSFREQFPNDTKTAIDILRDELKSMPNNPLLQASILALEQGFLLNESTHKLTSALKNTTSTEISTDSNSNNSKNKTISPK